MRFTHLIIKEVAHRKLNALLAVLSVTVAAGCLTASLALLRAHDVRTEEIVRQKETETGLRTAVLEDDYRKITKRLGFNVLILPLGQNLADLYADDYATKYMPEDYVTKLATSKIATIRHLLPSLQQKIKWPERQRTIILIGTRGEVPQADETPQQPIQQPVKPGMAVLGYELHTSLKLKLGDSITLLGKEFKVATMHPERGNKDDITIWIDLRQSQELLGKPGVINGILALECECAFANVHRIRSEITNILPDTVVIEFAGQALARAESRQRAAEEARAAVASLKQHRAALRAEQERFAAVLVPVAVLMSAVWVGLLALNNVRERRHEIGILRAIGVGTRGILLLFLGRAFAVGLLGAVIGVAAGIAAGMLLGGVPLRVSDVALMLNPRVMAAVLACAPALSVIASWLPALLAAQQDPAVVLREE